MGKYFDIWIKFLTIKKKMEMSTNSIDKEVLLKKMIFLIWLLVWRQCQTQMKWNTGKISVSKKIQIKLCPGLHAYQYSCQKRH